MASERPNLRDYQRVIDGLKKLEEFRGMDESEMVSKVVDEMSEEELIDTIKEDSNLDKVDKMQLFSSLKRVDVFTHITEDFEEI